MGDFFITHSRFFPDVDGSEFYHSIRNGLLHQAQTKHGWTIRIGQKKLCDPTNKIIDRDQFAGRLEAAFKSYLRELRRNDWTSDIWQKAERKIWWLVRLSL